MGLLGDLIEPRPERRAFGAELAKIPGPLDAWRSHAGPVVTEDNALYHIDVYKCVSLISDAIAMLPIRAMRKVASKGDDGIVRTYAMPVPRQPLLLTDPLPDEVTSPFSFKQRVMMSLLLAGHTYNEVAAKNEQGTPTVVVPIHPSKVRDIRINSGLLEYVMHDGGVLGDYRAGGTMVAWPAAVQAGSLKGISPIRAGMQGIALGMAAEEFGARWFGDGANPSGYLKDERSRDEINKTQAEETQRKWAAAYSGLTRTPAYLYGDLDWHPISVNPEESQFIETRKLQSGQIAGLYRVPPHLVSDVDKATSWGTGIEEQGLGFVVYTLQPWLTRLEMAMSMLLPRGQYAKVNVGALLRGKAKDRYDAYARGRQWGWLSVNDIRYLEDLPPIEEGDIYLQPLNMAEAGHLPDWLEDEDPNNDFGGGTSDG